MSSCRRARGELYIIPSRIFFFCFINVILLALFMNRTSQKVIQKNRWLFTREQLANTPSNRDGIERSEERLNRQNATCLIHDCGKKLNLPQQTINIGIVLLHRFFMLQSGFDSTLQIAKTFFGHESECFYVNNVGLWYGVNFFG